MGGAGQVHLCPLNYLYKTIERIVREREKRGREVMFSLLAPGSIDILVQTLIKNEFILVVHNVLEPNHIILCSLT